MAETKTNETEEQRLPETWAELKREPWFKDVPQLAKPSKLTVGQSAAFAVTQQRLVERDRKLRDMGMFKPADKREDTWDEAEATVLIAEIIEYSNVFYRSIAKKPDEWDTWTEGRDFMNLYAVFTQLTMFYTNALGKSSDSKTPSTSAE
ncbi:hypothetical protein [Bifidobacterium platyrrhinorum]|uniref:Uncharacterized protein n=1 Tax=Bifidobacterium platyrrhinorum TaxID=2661628 RepID=A0A6L9SSD2_9BIFI|nr:hypothetical protein [Bifidobacterium platyrrhinorum]NEG55470.1 hypothetical protein [Bifidobacterium platyrrhinorum]